MKKRILIWGAIAMTLGAILGAALVALNIIPGGPFRPAAVASRSLEFKRISWVELVPRGSDSHKRFRDLNLGALDDSSPRAQEALREMRAAWDNAPIVAALDGAPVKLAGYVVPLDGSQDGLKEFLLVPYFGACIHMPPPPANQIVHVVASKPLKGILAMSTVWVSGTLKTGRKDSPMGMSGYRMESASVAVYVPPERP